ncbi:CHAT domain-containing protein [Nodosilinea sp. LEGE 06152]|uniref:CHAT domain-containing protein n=1 Tax=Nodosilinea sp. LEGE 06152 TaxID=2777966 RepID=UPI0018827A3C|nr:CHAT domain-containing protein [Nodosilinea sp. LEGE 06152]MBE9160620.1 CHAT domain-containing protein [Nodosilinea sp. LEGE 06152]
MNMRLLFQGLGYGVLAAWVAAGGFAPAAASVNLVQTPTLCQSRDPNQLLSAGIRYFESGNFQTALDCLAPALQIVEPIARSGSPEARFALGQIYYYQGFSHTELTHYAQALTTLNQALSIFSAPPSPTWPYDSRDWQSSTLLELATVTSNVGDYSASIQYIEAALRIYQSLGNSTLEAQSAALNNLGLAHRNLGQYDLALQSFQESLQIKRQFLGQTNDLGAEATTLGNIARTLTSLERYQDALPIARSVLTFRRQEGDLFRLSVTLNDLGNIYTGLKQYDTALAYYREALAMAEQQQNLSRQALTLRRIGALYSQRGDLATATVFLKQSVNVTERFRKQLVEGGLSEADEQSYLSSVEESYRLLADVLIKQGRILEAQQVLDLLKLEEIREFNRQTRAVWTSQGLVLDDLEREIVAAHNSLIELGRKILVCEQGGCPSAELNSYYRDQERLVADYNGKLLAFYEIISDRRANDPYFQYPDNLSDRARDILATPNTMLVYPFVLDDRLVLLWATAGGIAGQVEVSVDLATLSETVWQFRQQLQEPEIYSLEALQQTSQTLHSWLIAPLEASLRQSNIRGIQRLVFAHDRVTRYIPMAALYDGEQYLVQRYALSTVLAVELTDTTERLGAVELSPVLGLGLSQKVPNFTALPYVEAELEGIIRNAEAPIDGIFPGQIFLNDAFNLDALRNNARNHRIVHIATHAEFVPGLYESSYFVLGNGDRLSMNDVDAIGRQLQNVHLVVLSACETALGGQRTEDGREIAGISAYFLAPNRAKTVIASLWKVADASTSVFMQRFYGYLAQGLPKGQALQRTQQDFLDNPEAIADDLHRGGFELANSPQHSVDASHPFFWAPFILIGNDL